jgi:hypothetical protein
MSKSGVTNTLQESLMLEQQLKASYDSFDKAETERDKAYFADTIVSIKKRMYKLPNYNVNGLMKIMKFFKPYQGA